MKAPARLSLLLGSMGRRKELVLWSVKYGAVFLVFLFIQAPLQSRLASRVSELHSLKRQITDLKQISTNLLDPTEMEALRRRVDGFESRLADEAKASEIMDRISASAEKNHLKMIQIYPDSPAPVRSESGKDLQVAGKTLHALPVSFRVEADYKNLANFLKSLEDDLKWVFTVDSMLLKKASEEAGTVQSDLTLSFFTL